ncbi:TetR/AcrR family transcriptional regulator; helix-turn-helix transcriptional regulator [Glycomyces sp. A-F 0318]|uniref:TetR/AcrR family transcriptional regulator n=1 Tax=Glycomyces amatae TaxID=2881355 RepID=UPI001E5854A2|nr:TetR/AcrR family transcriptional regulator [Glycomyces amatae]MCD0442982.1 TetR/AcrR family transcriptional regulator; helix-turn-helix transcriptional regulator [Glycomyces amatae]
MTNRAETAREAIAAAAAPVFGRYGHRKTTMDMIANAAGLSRPAVYQYFPNKDAVFRAVAARVGAELHAAAAAAGATGATTADRLFNLLAVKLDFAAAAVAPDHRHELVREAAAVAADLVAASEAAYTDLVASVLADARELDLGAVTAEDAAALLTDAMVGIARSSATADRMRARLRLLVDLTVRGFTPERSTP